MLSTTQLESIGQKCIQDFDGVFAINELPTKYKSKYRLICNTDSSNLPGKHWLAVVVKRDKEGYVFDPFGHAPPLRIQQWLNARGIKWECNKRQFQPINSVKCGHYCLYFLFWMSLPAADEDHYENIIRTIFPYNLSLTQHESNVINFVNRIL